MKNLQKIVLWGVEDLNIGLQLMVAQILDLFEDISLNVTFRFLETGTNMPQKILKKNDKPFAFVQTAITNLFLIGNRFRCKIVSPLAHIQGSQKTLCQTDVFIEHPNHLVGKKLGLMNNAAGLLSIYNFCRAHGVSFESLEITRYHKLESLISDFMNQNLDIITCWEPWTSRLKGNELFSGNACHIPGYEGEVSWLNNVNFLSFPVDILEKHPDIAEKILRVFYHATYVINHDFEKVEVLLAERLNIDVETLRNIIALNTYSMHFGAEEKQSILSFRNFLFEKNLIPKLYEEGTLIDSQYLKAVEPSLVYV